MYSIHGLSCASAGFPPVAFAGVPCGCTLCEASPHEVPKKMSHSETLEELGSGGCEGGKATREWSDCRWLRVLIFSFTEVGVYIDSDLSCKHRLRTVYCVICLSNPEGLQKQVVV